MMPVFIDLTIYWGRWSDKPFTTYHKFYPISIGIDQRISVDVHTYGIKPQSAKHRHFKKSVL